MPTVFLNKWMSGLKEDRKLVDLCLPGSHDAGVYTDTDKNLNPSDAARCQEKKIAMQARYGSRVFDIRCFLKDNTPTMGHFFQDIAVEPLGDHQPLGDWGGTLESALDDALDFLGVNTKEFLIFRIGHTECTTEVHNVLKKTIDGKPESKLKYAQVILNGPRGNLANLQVRDLQGKLLLIFGEEFFKEELQGKFHVRDGYYPYVKYPNIPDNGLSFCGTYVSSQTANPSHWNVEGAVKIAKTASKQHKDHDPNAVHLFWVYWQKTGGTVSENATKMQNHLAKFLSKFNDPKTELGKAPVRLPNVIGHDFVNKKTCGAIVNMNVVPNFKPNWTLDPNYLTA